MNIHLIVASLLLYTTGISALNNVNTYSYSWSDPTTSNYYVTVPNDFATSFRLTFSANPSHDFSIGLYSHGYAIPYALGSYEPDAIVEYIVGGWDTGSNDSQHSAARFGVATESGFYKKEINFVDSATPHTQYIIPGERGSVITYIYTVILTSTNCTISLEYIDPTTEEIVPLLSTTQSDFPSDMLQQLQSTTFNGFTHVGFRAYDAPYAVTNATIGIPQQMLNAATHSIQTAQAACSEAMQTSLRNVNALAQDVVAAAQKLPRAIPTRAELIETAQTIQTTVTEPNLHYLNRALITLGTLPSYTTPIDAQRVKSTADTLTLQLTTIAQSCPETTDRLRTLSQQMTAALGTLGVFNRPYTQSGSYALTADLFTFNLIDKADNAGDLCIALYDDANNQLYKVSIGCKSNTTSKLSLLDPALATIYGDALWHNGQTTTINATTLSIATDMTGAASYTQSNPALVWDQTPFCTLPPEGYGGWIVISCDATNYLTIAYGQGTVAGTNVGFFWRSPIALILKPTTMVVSNRQTYFTLTNIAFRSLTSDEVETLATLTPQAEIQNTNISQLVYTLSQTDSDKENNALNTAIFNANQSVSAAIASLQQAYTLVNSADQQAQTIITAALSLPASVSNRNILIDASQQLQRDLTNGTAINLNYINMTLSLLQQSSAAYTSITEAQIAQAGADTIKQISDRLINYNPTLLNTISSVQLSIDTAQAAANSIATINENNEANTKAQESTTAAITALLAAQSLTTAADEKAQAVIAAASSLPSFPGIDTTSLLAAAQALQTNSVNGTQTLLTTISSLLTSLTTASSHYAITSDAQKASQSANAAKIKADAIIANNPTIRAVINSMQSTVADVQIAITAALLANAIATINAHHTATHTALKKAQEAVATSTAQAVSVLTAAQALTDTTPEKTDLVAQADTLQTDPVFGTIAIASSITTMLATLNTIPLMYESLASAQATQATVGHIKAAAETILINNQSTIEIMNTLQLAITAAQQRTNAIALQTATTAANKQIEETITTLQQAQTLTQNADSQALAVIAAATNLPDSANTKANLSVAAHNLQTDSNNGTIPALNYIVTTLRELNASATYTSIKNATAAQAQATSIQTIAQAIIAGNDALCLKIQTLRATIDSAQQAAMLSASLITATTNAVTHIANAVNSLQQAQSLLQNTNSQALSALASAQSLPSSVPNKQDLTNQAQDLQTNQTYGTTLLLHNLNTFNNTLQTLPSAYSSVDAALQAQATADDLLTSINTIITHHNNLLVPALSAAQLAITIAQQAVDALSTATSTAIAHTASAITTLQDAQLFAQSADTKAQAVAVAANNLSNAVSNRQDLITQATNLLTDPITGTTTLLYAIASSLTTLINAAPTYATVSEAFAAQQNADTIQASITARAQTIPSLLTTISALQSTITTAQQTADNTLNAAALSTATHETNARIAAAITVLQNAQLLIQSADMQAQTAITAANNLPATTTDKQTLINQAQDLQNNPATGTNALLNYITARLNTLLHAPLTYASINDAIAVQQQADTDKATGTSIITNNPALVNIIQTLQSTITTAQQTADTQAAMLIAATSAAHAHNAAAIISLQTAQSVTQGADAQAQAVLAKAQALSDQISTKQALIISAQNLQTDPILGTATILNYIANALNTLQQASPIYPSINSASIAQTNADSLKATADTITANNTAILTTISSTLNTIAMAEASAQFLSPLDQLNASIAMQFASATQALATTQEKANAALVLITSVTRSAAALPQTTNVTKLLRDANSLKSTMNSILNKITATQNSLQKQIPPFSDQTSALKAKAIVESSASYAQTTLNNINARMQSIATLQEAIASATIN